MIPGYTYIYRESPEHEPQVVGTNAPVSWIVREIELGLTLDKLVEHYDGKIPRAAFEDALKYAREHPVEINRYVGESIKSSGSIFRTQ